MKRPDWVAAVLALTATAFLQATAKMEERENVRFWGAAYREYMQHSKMFIPLLW